MDNLLNLEAFLESAGYTESDWASSGLDWSDIKAIADSHEKSHKVLSTHSGSIANRLQGFEGVHSVRWRVKDTFSLIKKILRKNLENPPKQKWQTINAENYTTVVSDLIGIRALHLLKEDCVVIDEQIREIWNIPDTTVFKRYGDRALEEIVDRGATECVHEAGYRSIHYDLNYGAEKKSVLVEIQVRTIFQEGWSEIDHKVKYPDFSDSALLTHYLDLFNSLSGTIDEMGSFVIKLDALIKTNDTEILKGEVALASRDADIENLQKEIYNLKSNETTSKVTIESLRARVDNIKKRAAEDSTKIALTDQIAKRVSDHYRIPTSLNEHTVFNTLSNMFNLDSRTAQAILDAAKPYKHLLEAAEKATASQRAASKIFQNSIDPDINKAHEEKVRTSNNKTVPNLQNNEQNSDTIHNPKKDATTNIDNKKPKK
ncbi:hypothetical protein AO393_17260 [Pseudomonas syringae pv. syringae]|uniref:RelA/SpoT domain-containing protein n=1 Tax=Pseudomonas syringae TaxID=317 RepID=UPI000C07E1C3|nr:RelA/SpoT domain-containing protein [Pseudomonas syringae]PHN24123.1 hypothetical protein AO256_08255 [Pseudomonas syringae]PHX32792.1 hypothetical protein AO278_23875 [Pseudomonas syringae pv. syringae]PHX50302.1 hypothetical protein AO393_17260 [Pseudomonas syringae pv. syringae]RMR46387.1 Nucleotidyltransferase domain protein [Pseudomonas syringae pv. syringae]